MHEYENNILTLFELVTKDTKYMSSIRFSNVCLRFSLLNCNQRLVIYFLFQYTFFPAAVNLVNKSALKKEIYNINFT